MIKNVGTIPQPHLNQIALDKSCTHTSQKTQSIKMCFTVRTVWQNGHCWGLPCYNQKCLSNHWMTSTKIAITTSSLLVGGSWCSPWSDSTFYFSQIIIYYYSCLFFFPLTMHTYLIIDKKSDVIQSPSSQTLPDEGPKQKPFTHLW